jgi:MFS transporter, CP family, cyanate transporter
LTDSHARTHWPAMLTALAAGCVAATYIGKLPPAIPTLRADFGLSLLQAGWLVSAFNLLAITVGVMVGLAAGRVGALRMIYGGAAALAIGGVLGAVSPSAFWLYAARFVEGIGFLAIVVAAPMLISAVTTPQDRRMALGFWGTYMPIGTSLMMFASPMLIQSVGWRGLWLTAVGIVGVMVIAVWAQRGVYAGKPNAGQPKTPISRASSDDEAQATKPARIHQHDTASTTTAAPAPSFFAPLKRLGPWLLGSAFALYAFQFYIIMIWLPTYLKEVKGLPLTTAAMAAATMVFANVFGNIAGGALLGRGVPRGVLIVAGSTVMGVSSFVAFSEALPDSLRFAAVLTFSIGGIIPAAVLSGSQTYAHGPAEVAAIQGLLVQLSNFGQFTGPPLTAAVVGATPVWGNALYLLLGAASLCAALGAWVIKLEARAGRPY